uniref:Uncharacterized protein n=1 Tax=Ananas comosus var. bracteatus TaxID=296719 RepID=A0A6V7Q329_ANACO|nr:unnamed protein product [Ananas comosus var. bracteatus]
MLSRPGADTNLAGPSTSNRRRTDRVSPIRPRLITCTISRELKCTSGNMHKRLTRGCFERGHFAVHCRESCRCLLCMSIGHSAVHYRSHQASRRRPLQPGASIARPPPEETPRATTVRPTTAAAVIQHNMNLGHSSAGRALAATSRRFLLERGPSGNRPSSALVAWLPGLRFQLGVQGGYFLVYGKGSPLPNWVARESAIG